MIRPDSFGSSFGIATKIGSFAPEAWQHALEAGPISWGDEQCELLMYDDYQGKRYWLHIWRNDAELSLKHVTQEANLRTSASLISVGDEGTLNEFAITNLLEPVSHGSFMPWEAGSTAIVDFLRDPTQPSSSVTWTDADALDWPTDI